MQDLTKLWKRGKLKDGFYWVEFQDGEITPTTFSNQHGFICCDTLCNEENIKQILQEMPSYEENNACKDCLKLVWEAAVREVKLKGLLKECKDFIDNGGKYYIDKRILLEIEAVLQDEKDL